MSHCAHACLFLNTRKECWEEWDLVFLNLRTWNRNFTVILLQPVERHGWLLRLRSGEPWASLWSLCDDSEGSVWRLTFQIRHFRQSDSLPLWLKFCVNTFQQFQYYDFQIIIAVIFHIEWNLSCVSKRLQ